MRVLLPRAASNHKSKKKKKSSAEASDQSAEKNASGKKASKIDVNTASKEDLDALPGIGDAYAQKIIEGRPYKSKSDLVRKGVLPASEYDKVKDQIAARQSKSSVAETSSDVTRPSSSAKANAQPKASPSQNTESSSGQAAQETQTAPEKGMVWVNLDSGVYHREVDRWYGKTKHGKYMSESDAQKAGYRASKSGSSKTSKEEE